MHAAILSAATAVPANAMSLGTSVMQMLNPGSQATEAGSQPGQLRQSQIDRAATEFESIFISMMMKELRQTQSGEGMFPGDKSDTFGGMFDMLMGQHMAAGGGIGLSDFLKDAGGHFSAARGASPASEGKGSVAAALAAYESGSLDGMSPRL